MAISQASLSTKIQADIIAQFGAPTSSAILTKFANAIAKAVVDEIQANATVASTGTVTSGVGSGGAVTTTGAVT